jgi:DNA polymerase-3 subunit gamma/tau
MTYQVLARKWRPRTFAEVVGQSHVVRALTNALDEGRVHHAFLFTGTRGVGKTTLARILAKCLNCEAGVSSTPCGGCAACREIDEGRFLDLLEVDAASRTKVEDTRDLLENVPYAPTRGRYKVYLIDEVHMLSAHSFNALLKTLEEPPPHVKFLLATTDPQRLPVTILSRCLQFNLKRLPAEPIAAHLGRITEAEVVASEPAALRLLAVAADGSVRDALSLLDQAIAFGGGRLTEADVRAMLGSIDPGRVFDLLDAVAAGDGAAVMQRVADLAEHVADFDNALSEVSGALHRIALAQLVPEAVDEDTEERARITALAERLAPEDVQLFYEIALMGRRDLPVTPEPRSGFEMTLLRMLAFRPAETTPAARARRSGASTPAPEPPASRMPASRRLPSSEPVPGRPAAEAAPTDNRAIPPGSDDWDRVLQGLDLSGLTREMALNSVLLGRDGDTVRLLLAGDHTHVLSDMRKVQLQDALARYYGAPIRLLVEVGTSPVETPAARQRRDEQARLDAAVRAIDADPNVQSLRETFGARVVDGSVRPER